jgi:hypothetical protein
LREARDRAHWSARGFAENGARLVLASTVSPMDLLL